jgi:hypothetical protein
VLTNVGSFQNEEQLATRAIIIEDDNLRKNFLSSSLPILLLMTNNKWMVPPTQGFYGFTKRAETKYHFTESNSPLPSNVINDITVRQEKSTSLLQRISVF